MSILHVLRIRIGHTAVLATDPLDLAMEPKRNAFFNKIVDTKTSIIQTEPKAETKSGESFDVRQESFSVNMKA